MNINEKRHRGVLTLPFCRCDVVGVMENAGGTFRRSETRQSAGGTTEYTEVAGLRRGWPVGGWGEGVAFDGSGASGAGERCDLRPPRGRLGVMENAGRTFRRSETRQSAGGTTEYTEFVGVCQERGSRGWRGGGLRGAFLKHRGHGRHRVLGGERGGFSRMRGGDGGASVWGVCVFSSFEFAARVDPRPPVKSRRGENRQKLRKKPVLCQNRQKITVLSGSRDAGRNLPAGRCVNC